MKLEKLLFLLILTFSQTNTLFAQGDDLFNDDIIHEIYLTFDDDSFWSTLTANYDNNYPDVPYIMANAVIDGNSIDSIGVRLKGFSSYWVGTNKKSIKLDFNEFVGGKKYDGLKKVNLNNGEGDPAIQRDKICYDLMRESGVYAPRTAYIKVYLNATYWGLYLLVEQIDKTFLESNFGNKDGNLFKNMANSELDWQGADTTTYQSIFDLKTGYQEGAWDRFVNLMDVINNTSNANFKEEIEQVFDVDLYLKVLAVDVATNNWDSYIEHGRNFYMYEDPDSKKFQWIPWDYNLSMGGQFSSFGGGGGPGGGGGGGTTEPEDCPTILNGSCPYPATDSIFIEVIGLDDFCCSVAWDGTCQALYDNIAAGGNGGGGGPGGGGGGPGLGNNFPIDMSSSQKVLIQKLLSVPEYQERYYQYWCNLLDDNFTTERIFPMIEFNGDLIRDDIYDDPNYMWTTQNFEDDLDQGNNFIPGLKKFIQERKAALDTELDGLYDCDALVSTLNFNDVVINEFAASMDSLSGISDSDGEYDDWIEIYNNTSTTINLSNAYLTDDVDDPKKWQFPAGTTIDGGAYLIVWADKDTGQPGLHANFKLNKDGDFIMLTDFSKVLDSLSFGSQTTNEPSARVPNGTGDFVIQAPTFNDNNQNTTSINPIEKQTLQVKIYPNPADNFINIELEEAPKVGTMVSLFNSVGQRILRQPIGDVETILSLQSLNAGIYILSIENQNEKIFFNQKITVLKSK